MAVVSGAVLAALVFRRVAERIRMPAPVVFLLAAAVASDLFQPLGTALSPTDVSWIASGRADVILFDRWRVAWVESCPPPRRCGGHARLRGDNPHSRVMAVAAHDRSGLAGPRRRYWAWRSLRPIRRWCSR